MAAVLLCSSATLCCSDCVELWSVFLSQPQRSLSTACADEFERTEGMRILVTRIARYRRMECSSLSEVELMESLFDVLCQLLRLSPPTSSQASFAASDGVLALLAILDRRTSARFAALKALDHASQHQPANVREAIAHNGISHVFALLTHRVKGRKGLRVQAEMEGHSLARACALSTPRSRPFHLLTSPHRRCCCAEHVLSILCQWMIASADTDLLRLLHKFTVSSHCPACAPGTTQVMYSLCHLHSSLILTVNSHPVRPIGSLQENDGIKVDRVVELLRHYQAQVS